LAENQKVELGDWFNSPLHPVEDGFEKWQLNPAYFPNAVFAGKRIINLPTDSKDVANVLKFLQKIDTNILE